MHDFEMPTDYVERVTLRQGRPHTCESFETEKTALVVVDMQNFFLDASCMAHPNGLKAVEPTAKIVEWCRKVGIQVSKHYQILL